MYSKTEEIALENLTKCYVKDFKIKTDERKIEIKSYIDLQESIRSELQKVQKAGLLDDERIKSEMRLSELSNMDYIGKISLGLSAATCIFSFLIAFFDDLRIRALILVVCFLGLLLCEIGFLNKSKMQSEIAYLSLKIDSIENLCAKSSNKR